MAPSGGGRRSLPARGTVMDGARLVYRAGLGAGEQLEALVQRPDRIDVVLSRAYCLQHVAPKHQIVDIPGRDDDAPVSYTHLRAHETPEHLVCRLLLEK